MSAAQEQEQARIVVGVDGSQSAAAALRWAFRQAELTGAALDAVIAWEYPVAAAGMGWAPVVPNDGTDYAELAAKVLNTAINDARGAGSTVPVRQRVVEGYPAQILLNLSRGADLLVVGSRGHGELAEALLGSVSQRCVHHATCPVLVVRGHKRPA
jgi:nucleotide-binding universal stress UspA family protein